MSSNMFIFPYHEPGGRLGAVSKPINYSAAPSHLTLETLGPSSTVISFTEKLHQYEEST